MNTQNTPKKVKVKSVKKIEHDGTKVYDVTMKSNPHTFFANNILVHNSCYFRILEAENLEQAEEIGKQVVDVCDNKSIPALVQNVFNGADCMRSDFEAISSSTLSFGKKKQYAFLKAWEDGETLPKPKLGITGLSLKRSDSPKQLTNEMKPFFVNIMKGTSHDKIKEEMDQIEKDYNKLNLYDLSAKRSANNLSKYLGVFNHNIKYKQMPYNIEKLEELLEADYSEMRIKIPEKIRLQFSLHGTGTYSIEGNELINDVNGEITIKQKLKQVVPGHIKAAILYNYLIDEKGLEQEFNKVLDGGKIKIFNMKPVKIKTVYTDEDGEQFDVIQEFDAIAFPSDSKHIPEFLNDFGPDKKKMLETYFFNKMETLFGVIDFDRERMDNASMDALF